jgi:hypothetical protein
MTQRILIALACAVIGLGCSDPPAAPADGAVADTGLDASNETDAGDTEDAGESLDGSAVPDGGDAGHPSGRQVIGGFSTSDRSVGSGTLSVVGAGFEWSEPACVGTRCVVGTWLALP